MTEQANTVEEKGSPQIELIQMESSRVRVSISTLGATVQSLQLFRSTDNQWVDVCCGYDTPQEYLEGRHYFGASVGRYANRIANGSFRLNGTEYELVSNNGPHALHGGVEGFHRKIWSIQSVSGVHEDDKPGEENKDVASVSLVLHSKDMEEGYPCDVRVIATYCLSKTHHTLTVRYETTNEDSSRWTIANLVNHSYWNLDGFKGETPATVLDHQLRIDAPWYVPIDDTAIPTGEILAVKHTLYDFTAGKKLREAVEQLTTSPHHGLDNTFVLRTPHDGDGFRRARLELRSATGWVAMRCATNNPGIHVYTGNYLGCRVKIHGHGGVEYVQHGAVCLEAQLFPDTPNQRHFPSAVLKPKETHCQWQSFQFVFSDSTTTF